MPRLLLTIASLLLTLVSVLSCRNSEPGPIAPTGPDATPAIATDGKGLVFRLSHAEPAADAVTAVPQAVATSLSSADTAKVLARLPPMPSTPGDAQAFAKRKGSAPPPRTGATVLGAFPPKPSEIGATPRPKGPLSVARWSPEGDVPLAPHLSVTFTHPMVAVTSLDALDAKAVPVTLSPLPEGKWRWVGTRTLMFEPVERLPMATEFTVTVPAATKSAVGTTLGKAQTWSFTTPAPRVQSSYPSDGQPTRRQPLVFVEFDQRIDPVAVAAKVRLAAGKAKAPMVRVARPDEVAADETIRQLAAQAQQGRWLAFVPLAPLPSDTRVKVVIGVGTPSAEGPRTTTEGQTFSFRTYGPMKITDHHCGYNGDCPPQTPFEIEFSNPIDAERFDPSRVQVEPELPGFTAEVYGDRMYVSGRSKGRTTYAVTVSADIVDDFGQRLGEDRTLEFEVDEARPSLSMAGSGLTVLDPAAKGRVSVFTVNHAEFRLRAWVVQPKDWREYLEAAERLGSKPRAFDPPGDRVIDEMVAVDNEADQRVETVVDLSKALHGGLGHVVVEVRQAKPADNRWATERAIAWVQSTRMGLQGHVDDERMLVWATALADGAPQPGVKVELLHVGARATTDARGLASLPLAWGSAQMIVARNGDDVAFLPESVWWWNAEGSWHTERRESSTVWYVFDDRGLYRPGEKVHLKGWLRSIDAGKGGDVGPVDASLREVRYVVGDAQGNEIAKGTAKLNAFGAFDTSVTLPDTVNLGHASVVFTAGPKDEQQQHWHSFSVQEFRRPEYEVEASVSEGPHVVGNHAVATVRAAYFAGGGLANAQVQWQVATSPGHYQPVGHDGFQFGRQRPWWMFWRESMPGSQQSGREVGFKATTDASGEHRMRIDFDAVDPVEPTLVSAVASVTDVNRQSWAASTSMVVHPSSLYVGLRPDRAFVQAGETLDVDAIVTDIDGAAQTSVPILFRVARVETHQEQGEWVEKELDPQTCERPSAADPVRCSLVVGEGGSYRVVAVVVDAEGRPNRTEIMVWVAGGDLPSPRDVAQQTVLLIPDHESYRAGQTAKISVSSPWSPAEGLVTVRRSGLVREHTIHLDGPSTTVEVPIDEGMIPGVTVQVDLVGSAPRRDEDGAIDPDLPRRPAFATGSVALDVPPRQRTLALKVEPKVSKIEPGGSTTVEVRVADADGRPVANAEVALVVVDESVLALSGYVLPDPVARFYPMRGPGVSDHYLRQHVMLARPDGLAGVEVDETGGYGLLGRAEGGAPGAMPPPTTTAEMADKDFERAEDFAVEEAVATRDAAGLRTQAPIALRSDFDALASFSPSVITDDRGRAVVPLTVPDNLTRYRITAVAVEGSQRFGRAESTITARLPLMVRPSAPRFLNFGDAMELPIVLQNQTESPMTVDLAVRTRNAELTAGAGRRVQVPANDRVEVRFPTRTSMAGTARFEVGAVTGRWSDAASFSLPVWTPATSEAFATYGEIDEGGVVQPVAAPPGVFPQFGGLEITTSSTALQALTDAVLYLVSYPYECSEQVASRVLAIAALRDVLEAFEAEGLPAPAELVATVERDVDRLRRLQSRDGGFSFWGGQPSWPYLTVHVAHALERAKAKGWTIPGTMRSRALKYLGEIERHFDPRTPAPVRRTIRAYALYVQRLAGTPDVAKAKALVDEVGVEALPLEALAWVLPTLHDAKSGAALATEIERHLGNRVAETAATAHFATTYEDGAHLLLHSDRRVDALVLEAMITTQPNSDLIPKLVRGLLGHRKAGRWSSTQENGFVLVALDRYFREYEKATPKFVAQAWLGDTYAGDHEFRGRTTERHHIDIPMAWLADHQGQRDLVLTKKGKGRLYYRVGMRYAPKDLELPARDAGFVVERRYEAVDDDDDVRQDADGTWRIRAGARVRVRLKMVAEGRRYHVALVDPLPAGLEALNPVLATTGALPSDPEDEGSSGGWWWWRRTWYEHQNLRDERVEAFTSLLWSGVHDYDYLARATTPGQFVVPPTKAEEMYHPETFGRGRGDRVVVESPPAAHATR